MIQIAPQFRILVAIEAVDGRKGIDSLAQLCREKLDADPFSGCVFIFRTRRRQPGGGSSAGVAAVERLKKFAQNTYVPLFALSH